MHVQPLRSSLFLHSLEDSVDAAASLSLPNYSDCPGPLEAGHLKARGLILTPAECKGKRRRWEYVSPGILPSALHHDGPVRRDKGKPSMPHVHCLSLHYE